MAGSNRTGKDAQFLFDANGVAAADDSGFGFTAWRLLSILPHGWSRPNVADSDLTSTNFEELLCGDLWSVEPVVMQIMTTMAATTTENVYNLVPTSPQLSNTGTGFIVFPPGTSPASTIVTWYLGGSGYITDWQPTPGFTNNERQIGSLTFQFDGKAQEPGWYHKTGA